MRVRVASICLIGLAQVLAGEACRAGSIFSGNKLGEIVEPIGVRSTAMGGTSLAFVEARNPSKANPAVWCTFDQTAIAVTLASEQRAVKDPHFKHSIFSCTPEALRIFVPVGYKMVFAGGLWPYSRADFSVSQYLSIGYPGAADSTYEQHVERKGGIHLASLGVAKRFRPWLWFGINLDLPFGAIEETWQRTFESPEWVDTSEVITQSYSGFVPTIGVLYLLGNEATIGGSYTPQVSLDSPTSVEAVLERNVSGDKRTRLPTRLAVGATYHLRKALLVSAEVKSELWGRAYRKHKDHEKYSDVLGVGLGATYLPLGGREVPYYQRISVSAGAYSRSSYYKSGGTPEAVTERFLTFGFGLPIAREQATIELSFEVGKRGDLSRNGAEEIVYRQHVGVCGWEKWF